MRPYVPVKRLGRLLTTLGLVFNLPLQAEAPSPVGITFVPGDQFSASAPASPNPGHDSALTPPEPATAARDRRDSVRLQGDSDPAPRSVRLLADGWKAGETNELIVELNAMGDEGLLSFSLEFDPGLLQYLSAIPGPASQDGTLLVNPVSTALGRLGAGLILPPGQTLAPGPQELMRFRFATSVLALGRTSPIIFGDRPTPRDVTGGDGYALTVEYAGVTLEFGAPPTLRISQPVVREHQVEFQTEGVAGRPVIIQTSTDLGGWQNVLTNLAGAGPVVIPWSATDGLRVFRAWAP